MSFVEVENVSKSFGDNVVLRNVTLEVAEHEVVCLIGASGSGKSTLLRCINLLEPIDEGRIVVDGDLITNGKVDAVEDEVIPEALRDPIDVDEGAHRPSSGPRARGGGAGEPGGSPAHVKSKKGIRWGKLVSPPRARRRRAQVTAPARARAARGPRSSGR